MTEDATPQPPMFVHGNDHLDRLLSDPQVAADVAEASAAAEEMDRFYDKPTLLSDRYAPRFGTANALGLRATRKSVRPLPRGISVRKHVSAARRPPEPGAIAGRGNPKATAKVTAGERDRAWGNRLNSPRSCAACQSQPSASSRVMKPSWPVS